MVSELAKVRLFHGLIALACVLAMVALLLIAIWQPSKVKPTDPHITACIAWVVTEHPENTKPGKTCKIMRERNPHEFPQLFK